MKWMAGRKQFDVFVLYFLVSRTCGRKFNIKIKKQGSQP
ncbi:hypothetical protein AB434_3951 [Heyndrickxia coagulans]|uniref:Uncharacterized protein n=1 Tax=Heyndrickxia coagulans TaxID=1398 RepID=A0AAN0T494_HEYCO|nr:hypothetical protein SB48_HM08orf02039 [Heyndrickxia coagulans]AKN56356.1 hypothetical protein AB434_3951 [Heyndrickxia coagulans]KYC59525.1 hypothetical protein B4100_2563 [Heyndrickxia coagulans]KYC73893.1 hypothetical protein B4096_2478 [Heyndrickxia coagulans]